MQCNLDSYHDYLHIPNHLTLNFFSPLATCTTNCHMAVTPGPTFLTISSMINLCEVPEFTNIKTSNVSIYAKSLIMNGFEPLLMTSSSNMLDSPVMYTFSLYKRFLTSLLFLLDPSSTCPLAILKSLIWD